MDYILEDNPKKMGYIYKKYPRLKDKINVLYVPTFRKNQTNSMNEIYKKFDFDKYNLIIKYHPLDKTRMIRDSRISSKAVIVRDTNINIYDLYKVADVIITDYSAASLEACLLEKPVYFYLYDIDEYREDPGLNIDLFEEMPWCTSKSFDEIMAWIEEDEYDLDWIRGYKNTYFDIDLR